MSEMRWLRKLIGLGPSTADWIDQNQRAVALAEFWHAEAARLTAENAELRAQQESAPWKALRRMQRLAIIGGALDRETNLAISQWFATYAPKEKTDR